GSGWREGYAILAGAQLALALCFAASRRQWPTPASVSEISGSGAPLTQTLRLGAVQLAVASFFLYVGIEAAVGAWLYSLLIGARGISMAGAGAAVSTYWGGLLLARVLLAVAPVRLEPRRVLGVATAVLALSAGALAVDLGPALTWAAIGGLGLAAGPIFQALIAASLSSV